jgi:hypothetical protein
VGIVVCTDRAHGARAEVRSQSAPPLKAESAGAVHDTKTALVMNAQRWWVQAPCISKYANL